MKKNKKLKVNNLLMRSLLATCLLVGVGDVNLYAGENDLNLQIVLNVKGIDPTVSHGGNPRTPMQAPSVTLDGYTLYTGDVWFDATLQLVDEDGEVVYTAFVLQGTPSVTLPSSLSGDYELRLLWGNWCFYGWINL